jgi:DNA end-binding protein Ku
MRSLWSGFLSFGLINIPVDLYSASNDIGLDLTMLHKRDKSPIRYMRVCRKDGQEVPWDQIVKGYEVEEGDYVVLTEEEIKKAHARKTSTIDIVHFCDAKDIDPIFQEKPYYLTAKKGGEKAYALIREALKKSKKVGVAKFVLRQREHLAAIVPAHDALILHQLRFESEIRAPDELTFPKGNLRANEMKMALSLIEQLTEKFNPHHYKDTYTEELKRMIKAKAKGRTPAPKSSRPKPTADVGDMMTLLMKSLSRERHHDTAAVHSR